MILANDILGFRQTLVKKYIYIYISKSLIVEHAYPDNAGIRLKWAG